MREDRPGARLGLRLVPEDADLAVLQRRPVQDGDRCCCRTRAVARDAITQGHVINEIERPQREDSGKERPSKGSVRSCHRVLIVA